MLLLQDLRDKLDVRLNDANNGQWAAASKRKFLNRGRQRTAAETRSYITTESETVVASTSTYDATPVFLPRTVRLGDNVLDRHTLGEMANISENWEVLPEDTPTRWIPVGGDRVRVLPTPDSGAAGIIGTVESAPTAGGTGYAVGDVLELDEGTGGKVVVATLAATAVATLTLNSDEDSMSRTVYDRGTGYTVAAGKATTAETGSGTGCTVEIATLATLDISGPSVARDMELTNLGTMVEATDTVTSTAHGLSVNDPIAWETTVGGMVALQTYYVKAVADANTFSFSATLGGSAFELGNNGETNNWGYDEVLEVADAHAEVLLISAEEEARRARPTMPQALDNADRQHALWLKWCEKIRVELGIN